LKNQDKEGENHLGNFVNDAEWHRNPIRCAHLPTPRICLIYSETS